MRKNALKPYEEEMERIKQKQMEIENQYDQMMNQCSYISKQNEKNDVGQKRKKTT